MANAAKGVKRANPIAWLAIRGDEEETVSL
jgi:hypothetical protein